MGVQNLTQIFDESYYAKLEGGILESFGRLFRNNLKLFIYPHMDASHGQARDRRHDAGAGSACVTSTRISSAAAPSFSSPTSTAKYLSIYSPDVLGKIGSGGNEWESMVPAEVAQAIKSRHLFGYR